MPIYEYRCKRGHTFEVLQRMVDDPLTACETCEAPAERVLHPPAVHFKGSGFYNTDYGTRKRARELKSSGESKSGNGDGGGGGGESKSVKDGSSSSSDTKSSESSTKPAESAPKTSAA